MEKYLKNYGKWIVAGLCVLIFILFCINLVNNKLTFLDTTIYQFVINFKSHFLTSFMKFITSWSSVPILILLELVSMFVLKTKKNRIFVGINLFIVLLINTLLKISFGRARPIELMLIEESGYSFPSAHAMVSLAFYGLFIYLLWQKNYSKKVKAVGTIILTIFIMLIGVSRIYLGVHYASDVMAGFVLSLAYLIVYIEVFNKIYKERKDRNEKRKTS